MRPAGPRTRASSARRGCVGPAYHARLRGNFYELFFEDTHTASRLLQLTLSSRLKNPGACHQFGAGVRAVEPGLTWTGSLPHAGADQNSSSAC